MNDVFMIILRHFVAENWEAFVSTCGDHGVDPDEVYVELGGTPE